MAVHKVRLQTKAHIRKAVLAGGLLNYIAATLRAVLDGHPKSRIEDLMPWRFEQPSSLAA